MKRVQILHMSQQGETSYAKHCFVQKQIISFGDRIIEEAVAECLRNTVPQSMGIADLGCSSSPNTLIVISKIINSVHTTCSQIMNIVPCPELRVSLNDLPDNDFNSVFMSMPEFFNNLKNATDIGSDGCFISAVAGSFYGRLFPKSSLHFVHSSSSLHWLSQAPLDLNKGKIYISKTSPASVVNAYLSQFERDFFVFLRSRAEEMVEGGTMVLSFMGRSSPDATAEVASHQWELLAQALMSMALESIIRNREFLYMQGFIEEERIDYFNAPYYAPYSEEIRSVIEEEGSFIVNHLEAFEIGWDGSCTNENVFGKHDYQVEDGLSRGEQVSITIRAVVETMLEVHFGREIMDELFRRYAQLIDDYFSKTRAKHIDLVISVTRKF